MFGAYLTKPIHQLTLFEIIADVLGQPPPSTHRLGYRADMVGNGLEVLSPWPASLTTSS